MMHGFGFGYSWGGFLFMILIWGLLIAAAVGVVRALFPSSSQKRNVRPQEGEALEIINRRYAQGEISREEYETLKKDLMEI